MSQDTPKSNIAPQVPSGIEANEPADAMQDPARAVHDTDSHDLVTALDIESSDWHSAVQEWREASDEVQAKINALQWPTPSVQAVDTWLAAVNRQTIAHTRCAALCEIQLQKNRPIK